MRDFTAPHIGITVPDLDAAVDWYTTTLDFRLMAGPLELVEDDTPLRRAGTGIYGEGFGSFRFAHLASPDDVGLELFQFAATPSGGREDNFTPALAGYSHMGLTAHDVGSTVARVVARGGKATEVLTINPEKGYQIAYCEDPWGTVIEFCSHPYVEMWS